MKKTQMTREQALEMARQESAKLLAEIDAETQAFIAAADTSKVGVESTYVNEWGQTMTTSSGLWLLDI